MSKDNSANKNNKSEKKKLTITSGKRYRLSIYRSLKHIYAQVIDDEQRVTLISSGSFKESGTLQEKGRKVAEALIKLCQKNKITHLFLDRGRMRYRGTLRSMIESLRESGIKI